DPFYCEKNQKSERIHINGRYITTQSQYREYKWIDACGSLHGFHFRVPSLEV
ncbi:MAG: hypothetical protein ACI9GB_003408, partial [Halioglobus sp.]